MKKNIILVIFLVFCASAFVAQARQTEKQSEGIAIIDARFGKDVKDRAIVDEDSIFEFNSKVFLWLKVSGGASDTMTVTWKQGDYTHETKLFVGGNPWRTWASKTASRKGDWTVTVSDPAGTILKELNFKVR
jgi:hypothetical protein